MDTVPVVYTAPGLCNQWECWILRWLHLLLIADYKRRSLGEQLGPAPGLCIPGGISHWSVGPHKADY